MRSLFSVFDPATGFYSLNLNWGALLRPLLIPSGFWLLSRKPLRLICLLYFSLATEIKLNSFKGVPNSVALVLVGLFVFIVCNNFFGLLPYVFTPSRHPALTRVLALSTWVGYLGYSTAVNPSHFFSHLAPTGTPKALIPFMVLIELVRSFMRPLTLAVRLAANIVAGHLLLVLVSSPIPSLTTVLMGLVLMGLGALLVLELGVSFIQSYVFMRLRSLYVGELQANNL